jgi:peptidoglycan/xylan/chitin deacetylase (PgdA/CDA1 family)
MRLPILPTFIVTIGIWLAAPVMAQTPGKIALTFDDLPAISLVKQQDYVDETNRRLLAGLRRHHMPATGFVNEYKLDELDRTRQIAVLRAWLKAGMDLGNHTFSHESPNDLGLAKYLENIAQGEVETKKLLAQWGRRERWFRPPNLETGDSLATKQAILAWLGEHGYTLAPVTMNATDWQFAEPYDDAIAHHDMVRAHRLRAAYLLYTAQMVAWYRNAAHALFGRDIAYVMLLHASRLNADSIDDLAAIFKNASLKPVSLDKAMRDPAYRTPDHYAKPDGVDWMERYAQTLDRQLPWDSFRDVPKWVQDEYDKVDQDRLESAPPQ